MSDRFRTVSFDSIYNLMDVLNAKSERNWMIKDPSYQLHSWSMNGYKIQTIWEKKAELPFQRFKAVDVTR